MKEPVTSNLYIQAALACDNNNYIKKVIFGSCLK